MPEKGEKRMRLESVLKENYFGISFEPSDLRKDEKVKEIGFKNASILRSTLYKLKMAGKLDYNETTGKYRMAGDGSGEVKRADNEENVKDEAIMTKQGKLLAYLEEAYPDGATKSILNDDAVIEMEIGIFDINCLQKTLYRLRLAGKIMVTGERGLYVYKVVKDIVGEEKKDNVGEHEIQEEIEGGAEVLESVELQRLDQVESADSALVMEESIEEEKKDKEISVDLKLYLMPKERRAYDQLLMLSKAVLGKEERRFNAGQLEQFHDGEREDFLQKLIEAGVIVKTGNDSDTVPGFPCYRIVEKFYLGLINRIEIDEIEKRENELLAKCSDFVEQYKQLLAEKERLDERLKVVNDLLVTIATGLKNDKSVAEELGEKRRVLSLELMKKRELHSCLAKIDALPEAEQALLRSLLTGE